MSINIVNARMEEAENGELTRVRSRRALSDVARAATKTQTILHSWNI
jgi:hypothetical protein